MMALCVGLCVYAAPPGFVPELSCSVFYFFNCFSVRRLPVVIGCLSCYGVVSWLKNKPLISGLSFL